MIVLSTIIGLAVAIRATTPISPATTARLLASLGWRGFLGYVSYSLAIFGLLGAAWLTVLGSRWTDLPAFVWARMLREAASDLLPFSQIGGVVVGADALIARGFSGVAVYAAITADLTTEMTSQVLFTLLGIGLFATAWPASADHLVRSTIVGSVVVIVLMASLARTAPRWIPAVVPAVVGAWMPDASTAVRAVADRLKRMYARRARMVASTALNFAAWTTSAAGAWLVLRWTDSDMPLVRVVSLEAFIFALRSVAFMVPGGIGVQEAGYALTAPLFGLPLEAAAVLAIAKRCKDVAIGLPTLIIWQLLETRTLASRVATRNIPR